MRKGERGTEKEKRREGKEGGEGKKGKQGKERRKGVRGKGKKGERKKERTKERKKHCGLLLLLHPLALRGASCCLPALAEAQGSSSPARAPGAGKALGAARGERKVLEAELSASPEAEGVGTLPPVHWGTNPHHGWDPSGCPPRGGFWNLPGAWSDPGRMETENPAGLLLSRGIIFVLKGWREALGSLRGRKSCPREDGKGIPGVWKAVPTEPRVGMALSPLPSQECSGASQGCLGSLKV